MMHPSLFLLVSLFISLPPSLSLSLSPISPSSSSLSTPLPSLAQFTVKEKLLSVSGEDFAVFDSEDKVCFAVVGTNKIPFGVGGLVLDKLTLKGGGGEEICTIERRAVALSISYDIYPPGGGKRMGKVERDLVALTPTFKFYYADNQAEYVASGKLGLRDLAFTVSKSGKSCATLTRGLFELTDQMESYNILAERGVDVAALVALACVIDEAHDEEGKKDKNKGGKKGGETAEEKKKKADSWWTG